MGEGPNISGDVNYIACYSGFSTHYCFAPYGDIREASSQNVKLINAGAFDLQANRSSSLYGGSTTVQMSSVATYTLIKI